MAWSWSYTNEGMEAAYENLRALPRLLLREIYAEWEASYQPIGDDGEEKLYAERELDSKAYDRFMEVDSPLPNDVMADSIWKCAERQSCCDNGAWLVWLCPFGCERHKVKPD